MVHFIKKLTILCLAMGLISFFSGCFILKSKANRALAKAEKVKPIDAGIVPGVPFNGVEWDRVMKARVIWSWILYKNGIISNVIYSGGAVHSCFVEAKIMGLYAQKLGIPKEHIFYDSLALHSTENVYYSYLLAKENGFKSLALVTDPFQSAMLKRFTKKRFATKIYHLPFNVDSLNQYVGLNPSIDSNSARVHEWTNTVDDKSFFNRMGGTMGHNIDWDQYLEGIVPAL